MIRSPNGPRDLAVAIFGRLDPPTDLISRPRIAPAWCRLSVEDGNAVSISLVFLIAPG